MTQEQIAKLDRLRNYSTLYEIAAIGPQDERILVAYAPRSRSRLTRVISKRAQEIVDLAGTDDVAEFVNTGDWKLVTTTGWTIKYTGRTQRDAITQGEYPFICRTQAA